MEIKVIISADPDLLAALNAIAQKFSSKKESSTSGVDFAAASAKKKPVTKMEVVPAAVQTETTEAATNEEDNNQSVTIEMVRAEVNKQKEAGKREKIKGLLTEFEVDKVTSLDIKQYPMFLKKLKAI